MHAFPVFAQETVRVVYTTWFPYTYTEEGEAKGFEIDILRAVFDRMDVDVDFIELPWKRCLDNLQFGDADALSSMLKTPERAEYAFYPEANISCSRVVLFTKKSSMLEYDGSFSSLSGKKIGYRLGFNYGDEFAQADYLDKDRGLDIGDIIKKVVEQHNDVGIANEIVMLVKAKELGVLEELRILSPPVFTKPLYVGFSKKTMSRDFVDLFSAELADFMQSEEYEAIFRGYAIPCR